MRLHPVTLEHHKDAKRLNEIANDPAVRPWVTLPGQAELDLTDLAADPRHVVLVGEAGALVFVQRGTGFFEQHMQVLSHGRGPWAIRFWRSAVHWMFTHSTMMELVSRVPVNNLGAASIARIYDLEPIYSLENGWVVEGKPIRADFYHLDLDTWASRAPEVEERGEWFHHQLESEYIRLGRQIQPHADDRGHNRLVGLALDMALGGAVSKGISYFNKWAAVLGHTPITSVLFNPLVVDIGTDKLKITSERIEVLTCP